MGGYVESTSLNKSSYILYMSFLCYIYAVFIWSEIIV